MAFKIVKNRYLTIDSVRKANWYYHYLNLAFTKGALEFRDTPERKAQAVIETLNSEIGPGGKKTEDVVAEMHKTYNQIALMDDEILWIKKSDKRLVFWLWNYLRENLQKEVNLYLEQFNDGGQLPDVSHEQLPLRYIQNYRFNFNHRASTHTERYDAIINAYDTAILNSRRKTEFNSQLRHYWETLLISVPRLSWLIRKPDEADKALAHLKKAAVRRGSHILPVPLRFGLADLYDEVEKSLAIQAILDFFYTDLLVSEQTNIRAKSTNAAQYSNNSKEAYQKILAEVRKLSNKMRNAFDERARRDRNKSEKSKNIQLSTKAQDMLNLLAVLKKQKAMKIIEDLLKAEFDNCTRPLPKYVR